MLFAGYTLCSSDGSILKLPLDCLSADIMPFFMALEIVDFDFFAAIAACPSVYDIAFTIVLFVLFANTLHDFSNIPTFKSWPLSKNS